jgi:putative ABC transport system permease protein
MRLYRLFLRLYPAAFRAEYEEEMCAVFAVRRRNDHRIALWTGVITDVVVNAARVHAELARQDVRWTLRALRRSPAFTVTAVFVAALGVGATTAAFTLINHVLLRPLPFPDPRQLVVLNETNREGGFEPATPPGFDDWRSMNRSFSAMGAYIGISLPMNMSGRGDPSRPDVVVASADVFRVLDVAPAVGRVFTADDERDDAPRVAILSMALANAMYGQPTAALGQTIRLDSRPYDIVGVMPASFVFPSRDVDVWLPRRAWGNNRGNHMLGVVARLGPGVTIDQARADMAVVASRLERAYPKEYSGTSIQVVGLRERVSPETSTLILAILGAALCLLLIGCTNLASLLFARALGRRQEIAVRVAIGAGRERLVRQLLTESFALALTGGAVGVLLAALAAPALGVFVPNGLPIGETPQIDWRVVVFAVSLTLATTVAFGAGPALRSSRTADAGALRSRGRSGDRVDRLRGALVVTEVVGTVVLLVAAGLLLKAMWRVQAVETGFRADGVLTLKTVQPMAKSAASRQEFYARVIDGARRLPGVTSAAYISFVPMTFSSGNSPVTAGSPDDSFDAHIRFITPDYFRTMGIPLLRGRDVASRDDLPASARVAVIGRSLAERLWPGQDALGRTMTYAGMTWDVIGIVGDVAVRGLEEPSIHQAYFPAGRVPPGREFYAPKDLVVHTTGNPVTLVPALRSIVRNIDPEQAISDVRTLEEIVAGQTMSRRAQIGVLGTFALSALLLASVGVYGLLSFTVSMRTREVGVRMALGASRTEVLAMFLGQGARLGLTGVAIAVPLAYLAGRGMTALLFGAEPGDPAIFAAASALAMLMTIAGSMRPAQRAAGVDPAITIQSE